MAKIRLAMFDALQPGSPDLPAERPSAGVSTSAVFAGPRDPIHLRLHHLPAGQSIAWSKGASGYLAYVWDGTLTADGAKLGRGSMIAVEHGGSATLRSEDGDAALLVFNRPATAGPPARAGGHVHLLPAERVPRTHRLNDRTNYGAAIFADSACPTCELWLHESNFHDPGLDVVPHYHTEDEVIVVIGGEIVLGQRRYGRGAALAVAKNTIYGFRTGPEGLSFINFRPSHPTYATPGNSLIIDEQALYAEKLGRPHYVE